MPVSPWASRFSLFWGVQFLRARALTPPVPKQPELTFDEVVDTFCQRYNSKHGAVRTLDALAVHATVSSRHSPRPRMVATHYLLKHFPSTYPPRNRLPPRPASRSKPVSGDAAVAETVSAGDDVLIVSKDGTYPEQARVRTNS